MEKTLALSSSVRLAWEEEGEGEPLLLVHGLGGWNWTKLIPELADRYRIFAPYLRGWGNTAGRMDYAIEDLAGDLIGFIEFLGVAPMNVVAHSLGGMVAQIVVTDRPDLVRRLVLLSTTSHQGRRARSFALAMATLAEKGANSALRDPSVRRQIETILQDAFPDSPPQIEWLSAGLEEPNPAATSAWRSVSTFTRKDRLSEIKCPVLVVHGSADLLIPYRLGEWIHEAIGHSSFKSFEAGHSIQRSHPEVLAQTIIEFLETSDPQQAARLEKGA